MPIAKGTVQGNACNDLPGHEELKALVAAREEDNGGFDLDMWGAIVDRNGIVCAVAFTGEGRGDQWPGSRVISAQKANTANAFSLPGLALSTANLFSAVQPGAACTDFSIAIRWTQKLLTAATRRIMDSLTIRWSANALVE